ncbi:MAG: hypothetical protein IKX20_08525 [Paludibacteraceae bacterium]|nr:hypothetical protein [Paludibacteraceae bacterium]
MTKAFLYDSLCGLVYRCMFAGVDGCGRAQWVNITPGEEPKTLEDYVIDEDMQGTRFFVLAMEGETAQSSQIAKILGKVSECPINGLGMDLTFAIRHMQDMGVKWNQKPLQLTVRVFENGVQSKRNGKYSFWIEDNDSCCDILADVDGFDSVEELFRTVRSFFLVLESVAGISCLTKDLHINGKLKKEVKKSDLGMFRHIEDEAYVIE